MSSHFLVISLIFMHFFICPFLQANHLEIIPTSLNIPQMPLENNPIYHFSLENKGEKPLLFEKIIPCAGCLNIRIEPENPLMPQQTGTLIVETTPNLFHPQSIITLFTSDPSRPFWILTLSSPHTPSPSRPLPTNKKYWNFKTISSPSLLQYPWNSLWEKTHIHLQIHPQSLTITKPWNDIFQCKKSSLPKPMLHCQLEKDEELQKFLPLAIAGTLFFTQEHCENLTSCQIIDSLYFSGIIAL